MALLAGAGPSVVRERAGTAVRTRRSRPARDRGSDPLAVASSLDVLAVCLAAGMAVANAAAATAASAPPELARVLHRAADLLALGADAATAWSMPNGVVDSQVESLLRLARVSAAAGAALADGVAELAEQSRHDAAHAAADFTYVSTAGGAFLEWLGGHELPAVLALARSGARAAT